MELDYFQLVDRVEHVDEANGRIEAFGEVPAADKSKIFEGHFPDYPIFPGVLLIEAMTQTAGFMVLSRQAYAKLPFLIQVDKAKLCYISRRFQKSNRLLCNSTLKWLKSVDSVFSLI